MEREWQRQVESGVTVSVKIIPLFHEDSKRPYRFDVEFQYDGNRAPTSPKEIDND